MLDAHVAAGDGLFRGIRHATALDADPAVRRSHTKPTPGLMAEQSFRAGVRELAPRDLSFDAWLYHPQITEVTALARAMPEPTIVLDHLGGPLGIGRYAGHRDEIMAQWRIDMAELADLPERQRQARRDRHGQLRARLRGPPDAADERRPRRRVGRADHVHDRAVRRRAVHVRVELPGRQGVVQLRRRCGTRSRR